MKKQTVFEKRHAAFSRFLDQESPPDEVLHLEKQLEASAEDRDILEQLHAVSRLIRDNAGFSISPEEEAEFDVRLARRLRAAPAPSSWPQRCLAPFKMIRGLSWQWQTVLAVSLLLICYVPILIQTPLESGLDAAPLIDSDYSNYKTFFNENPQAGYDLYGVLSEEEEKPKPEETPTNDIRSPLGFFSGFRA
ncbi:MAG: hypothetical protein JXR73_03720 [Candidatus Omnitrophica bacterium]|nr:hypothetical protein [Candidatus Omnitrophota bacterium]